MLQKLYAGDQYSATDNILVALALCGYWPETGCKILDFGCGSGGLVSELRARGFDAYGFDLHDCLAEDLDVPREFFRFHKETDDPSNMTFDIGMYTLPFDDDQFDLVVSISVLEHTMHLDGVLGEIARVTKPTGISFHIYPTIRMLIEPHTYVPFGTRFQSKRFFYLWSLLGIRNEFQENMTASETAERNSSYARTGLNFQNKRALHRLFAKHFRNVRYVKRQFHYTFSWLGMLRNAQRALFSSTPLRSLSRIQLLDAVLLEEKR